MSEISDCLCNSTNGFSTDPQNQKLRNSAFYRNGTVQFETSIFYTVGNINFKQFYPEAFACQKERPDLPAKMQITFNDNTLFDILKKLIVCNTDEKIQQIQPLIDLYKATKEEDNHLRSFLSNKTLMFDIDEDLFKENDGLMLGKEATVHQDSVNLILLKPEVWSDLLPNLDKDTYRIVTEDQRVLAQKTNSFVIPGVKAQKATYLIEGTKADNKKWEKLKEISINTVSAYADGNGVDICYGNKIVILPDQYDNVDGLPPRNSDMGFVESPIFRAAWSLNVPFTLLFTEKTIENYKRQASEYREDNDRGITLNNYLYRKVLTPLVNKLESNINKLCELIKYVDSISNEEDDNIINCSIKFFDKDDNEIETGNLKTRLYLNTNVQNFNGFQGNIFNNSSISIQFAINDDTIDTPEENDLVDYIRVSAPIEIPLSSLQAGDTNLRRIITINTVGLDPAEADDDVGVYQVKDNTATLLLPCCSKATEDYPSCEWILENKYRYEPIENFEKKLSEGIVCDTINDILYYEANIKEFQTYFGENNITFYSKFPITSGGNIFANGPQPVYEVVKQNGQTISRKIMDKTVPGEIVIYNNLSKTSLDCNEESPVNYDIIDTSVVKNTFFTELGFENMDEFRDFNLDKRVDVSPVIGTLSIKVPLDILQRTVKNEKEAFAFQVSNLSESFTVELPYKSPLTKDKVLYNPAVDTLDYEYKIYRKDGTEVTLAAAIEDTDLVTPSAWFLNTETAWYESRYKEILPIVLKTNMEAMKISHGPNFEYRPITDYGPPVSSIKLSDFNARLTIRSIAMATDNENKKDLPCENKIKEAITALEDKKTASINRYSQPVKDYISNIIELSNANVVLTNETKLDNILYPYNIRNAFYKQLINGFLTEDEGQTVAQIATVPLALKGDEVIKNKNSTLSKAYDASISFGGDEYYGCEKFINDSTGIASLIPSINLPKSPEFNFDLEPGADYSEVKIKKILSSEPEQLPFPGYIQKHIQSLEKILKNPRKYRQKCGLDFLGTGV